MQKSHLVIMLAYTVSAFPPAKFLAPLCHQIWPSEETIPTLNGFPILFLSGLKDEIVP